METKKKSLYKPQTKKKIKHKQNKKHISKSIKNISRKHKQKSDKKSETQTQTQTRTQTLTKYYNDSDKTDYFKYNPNFKDQFSCNYTEYLNIKKPEYNYKNFYKTYESDEQFKALIKIGFNLNPSIISRLLEMALKRFNPKLTNTIYKIITSGKKDSEIYSELRRLYKSKNNKVFIKSPITCKGNISIQQWMTRYLRIAKMERGVLGVSKYLDVGCGNGKFAITMGELLKLKKDDIYGVDLDNFSEQKDWGRGKFSDKFTFKELQFDKPYPFEDNYFDLITIKMVLHHVTNFDFTLKELVRIMKINGSLIIVEHDSFTFADYMLNDIEHGFYINVFNENNPEEDYLHLKSKQIYKEKESIGVHRYFSWVELDYHLRRFGFEYIRKQLYSNNINFSLNASRAYFYLYKLHNKEFIPTSHTY